MDRLTKAAILSISLLVIMTGNAVSPALSEIGEAFPHAKPYLIKMVLTLPSFVIIPFSFISGKISSVIKKRSIIIFGLILYIIGGVTGGFSRNIHELLFTRAILGMGMGFLTPYTTSLIADFYSGIHRTVMMGLSNAVSNFGGIFATLVAGGLAILNWRYIFGVYSIAIFVLFLVIFKLPEPPIKIESYEKNSAFNISVFTIGILALLLNIVFYSVVINISIFIKNEGIGNSGYSGIAMSSITLAGFVSGVCLRQISKFFKKFRVPIAIAIMGLGFLLLSTSYNFTYILISNFMIGFGLGILKPILFLKVSEAVPSHSNAFAISIISNSILFGKFISPFFLDFWGELFNNNTIRFIFSSMGLSLGCAAIIFLIIIISPIKTLNKR